MELQIQVEKKGKPTLNGDSCVLTSRILQNSCKLIQWFLHNIWSEATNRKLLAHRPCTITISTLLLLSKCNIPHTFLFALKSYWYWQKGSKLLIWRLNISLQLLRKLCMLIPYMASVSSPPPLPSLIKMGMAASNTVWQLGNNVLLSQRWVRT